MTTQQFKKHEAYPNRYVLTNDSFLQDAMQEAHNGHMPNDWVYDKAHTIWSSLVIHMDAMDEDDDINSINDDGTIDEIIDGAIDIYNADLYEWGKSFGYYVSQAREEGLLSDETIDIEKQLMTGQFVQLNEIAWTLIEAYKKHHDIED